MRKEQAHHVNGLFLPYSSVAEHLILVQGTLVRIGIGQQNNLKINNMKELMTQRMESMVITMHSLQMKNQPIKLEDIANVMQLNLQATGTCIRELQARELVVKVGHARTTIYHLTKKAEEAIEKHLLSTLLGKRQVQVIHQNPINKEHVTFMKQMNQFLKEHESLLEENKSLKSKVISLEAKLSQIKGII